MLLYPIDDVRYLELMIDFPVGVSHISNFRDTVTCCFL